VKNRRFLQKVAKLDENPESAKKTAFFTCEKYFFLIEK